MRIDGGGTVIRSATADDIPALIAGRDDEFHRWLGRGSPDPAPTACIELGTGVAGWVDYDVGERAWLEPGEVNIGYHVFAPQRRQGHATRAVRLLMHHLALTSEHHTATVLIERENTRSLGVAHRAGFAPRCDIGTNVLLARPIPPLDRSDGDLTIRRRDVTDLGDDLAAKDAEQQRWLWRQDERARWAVMTVDARREHSLGDLGRCHDNFGLGPKWTFSVDVVGARNVGYVDFDLANEHVAHGDANISYSVHPEHRGRGYAVRAVGLVAKFAAEHTGARRAHLNIDARNVPSLRVALATGARHLGCRRSDDDSTMERFVIDLDQVA